MTDNNKSLMQRIRGAGWGAIVLLVAVGVIFWGGFNWALEMTNTEKFCISCHEMEENVFKEYRNTVHYQYRTGVRAICPDCHVPKDWTHKLIRKAKASGELWGKLVGSIDLSCLGQRREVYQSRCWPIFRPHSVCACRCVRTIAA